MINKLTACIAAGGVLATSSAASAGSPPYFQPLTQSASVAAVNGTEELNAPWVTPAGMSQENLTSMSEIEGDASQSVVRAPSAGTSASMWDMSAFDATGRFLFVPHESPWGAGLSRYDRVKDENTLLWAGDNNGINGDWSKDYAAFDPATFTPNCTVFVAEEWSGEGRLLETLNPFAAPKDIKVRELESIANVAHEGLRFSHDQKTLYFVDEWNSGSIYKFVMPVKGDYTKGQTFVLKVDAFAGKPQDNWNQQPAGTVRTGAATWVPLTDAKGNPLTTISPFKNGPTNDPRTASDTRGGRPAADEVGATPYGRPEDMEIGRLANGHEVMYFAATSEASVYSVEMLSADKAMVRLFLRNAATPKNLGFAPTTGVLQDPDNLAQDALGNIYIIEDAPNGSSTGGDIWFARDTDNDGVAESADHFMSIRAAGSEATGMVFSPTNPLQFAVTVMHPSSVDLDEVPGGFGDAMWLFDVRNVKAPCASEGACGSARIIPSSPSLRWLASRTSCRTGSRFCAAATRSRCNLATEIFPIDKRGRTGRSAASATAFAFRRAPIQGRNLRRCPSPLVINL